MTGEVEGLVIGFVLGHLLPAKSGEAATPLLVARDAGISIARNRS